MEYYRQANIQSKELLKNKTAQMMAHINELEQFKRNQGDGGHGSHGGQPVTHQTVQYTEKVINSGESQRSHPSSYMNPENRNNNFGGM